MAMAQVLRAGQTAPSNRYSETRAPGFSGGTGDPASGNIVKTSPSFRPTPAPAIARPTPNVGAPPQVKQPAAPALPEQYTPRAARPTLEPESPNQFTPTPPQLAPETPPQSPPATPFTPGFAPAPTPSPLASPLPSPIQSAPPPPAAPETRLGAIEPPATTQPTTQPTFSDPYYALMFGSQPMGGPTSSRPGA